jgi:hypothetical protein
MNWRQAPAQSSGSDQHYLFNGKFCYIIHQFILNTLKNDEIQSSKKISYSFGFLTHFNLDKVLQLF